MLGLIGTEPTLHGKLYETPLSARGYRCQAASDDVMQRLVRPGINHVKANRTAEAEPLFRQAIEAMTVGRRGDRDPRLHRGAGGTCRWPIPGCATAPSIRPRPWPAPPAPGRCRRGPKPGCSAATAAHFAGGVPFASRSSTSAWQGRPSSRHQQARSLPRSAPRWRAAWSWTFRCCASVASVVVQSEPARSSA